MPPIFAKDSSAKRYQVEAIRVYLEARIIPSVELTAARYRDTPVAYARGQSPAGEFTITLIQPEHGSPKGAMSVKNPDTGKAHTVNIRFTADQKKLAFVADPVHGGLEDDAAQQQGGGYSPPAARSSKPTP